MANTRDDRNDVVRRYRESNRRTRAPYLQELTNAQARAEYGRQEKLLAEYGDSLPPVRASACPHCGQVLEYVFDAFGLDGMWWASEGFVNTSMPDHPHFKVLLGAIDFHGRVPREAETTRQILPGPGAPFVVPRLLGLAGMIVVISSLDLPHGDTAYLMAYFSDAPLDQRELHQPWARETFAFVDEEGDVGWTAANDPWDFDLQPWIDKGRVKWINPGDQSFTLQDRGVCPYVGLPGCREPQVVEAGTVGTLPLPDGEPFDPFG